MRDGPHLLMLRVTGLLLTLHSRIPSDGALVSIWDVGDLTWMLHVQGKRFACCTVALALMLLPILQPAYSYSSVCPSDAILTGMLRELSAFVKF